MFRTGSGLQAARRFCVEHLKATMDAALLSPISGKAALNRVQQTFGVFSATLKKTGQQRFAEQHRRIRRLVHRSRQPLHVEVVRQASIPAAGMVPPCDSSSFIVALFSAAGRTPYGWCRLRLSFDTTIGQVSELWVDCLEKRQGDAPNMNLPAAQLALGEVDVTVYVPPSTCKMYLRGRLCKGTRFKMDSCDIQEISPQEALWQVARQAKEVRESQGIHTQHFYQDVRRLARSIGTAQAIHQLQSELQKPIDAYVSWVHYFDLLDNTDRSTMVDAIAAMANPPLISIIMPTYNTPIHFLHAAISSIERQIYPHWELCIADDASPSPHVMQYLSAAAQRDPRIKVMRRLTNGHISAASNSALALATYPWVALFDHDDELPEQALFEVAQAIVANPNAKLIYTDEDKCDERGRRTGPYFKPAYNLDLLRSQNYISHLGVYARSVVESIGGFRSEMDGSQDYDLVLRTVEQLKPSEIVHIPHILYHWRIIEGSAAGSTESKPYAYLAGGRAIAQHLERQAVPACVRPSRNAGLYHVRYRLPDAPPHVSIIVLGNESLADMKRCIGSIIDVTCYPNFDIHLVQVASYGATRGIEKDSFQNLASSHTAFTCDLVATLNTVARGAKGGVLVFLDGQIEPLKSDWLAEMVGNALRQDTGAVGPKVITPHQTIYHGGIVVGFPNFAGPIFHNQQADSWAYFGRRHLAHNYSAVAHDCLVLTRECYCITGGFDTSLSYPAAVVDLCLKLRALGHINVWTPHAQLLSHSRMHKAVTQHNMNANDTVILRSRWHFGPRGDPHFSPNIALSFDATTPSFAPRLPYTFRAAAADTKQKRV